MTKVSTLIIWEGSAFLSSVFLGMMLALEYDCIRIFRRIVKHRHVYTMAVEDIIFWFHVSIVVFCSVYEMNNGIVRGFIVVSQVLGAVLYRYAFGRYFVKYISKFLLFVLKPLKKLWRFIKIKTQGAVRRLRSRLAAFARSKKRGKKCSLNPDGKNSSV